MEQQEQTTENEQKNTGRSWQGDRRSLSRELRTAGDPHYVVITGTNIRSTLPGQDIVPKVYDNRGIAQAAVSADTAWHKRRNAKDVAPKSPISVEEYDRKYSAYMNTLKE